MMTHIVRIFCLSAALALTAGLGVQAQNHMPPTPAPPGAGSGAGPMNMPPNGATRPAPSHRPGSNAHAGMVGTAPSEHNGVQFGPVGRWWDNKNVVNTIGLSVDQKRKMDTIFNANKPAIVASYQTYLKERSKLNALSRNPQTSQSTTFAAIDSVNQARSALQKATAQMYIELRQQMSAEQIQKLEKLE